jgi:hypothetical protein
MLTDAVEECGLAALDAHLSDGETVVKMGHPVHCFGWRVVSMVRSRVPVGSEE